MVESSHKDVLLVVGHVDVELSQALGEFLEVDLAVVVFVKLAQQVHAVVLH